MTGTPTHAASDRETVPVIAALLRRGQLLEAATLGWNVASIAVLTVAVVRSRSVALVGFGLDSLIEIGASAVVLWELNDTHARRQQRGLSLIRTAFVALAAYLMIQSVFALADGVHPRHSTLGIIWTATTALVMAVLATVKGRTGTRLENAVLITEGRVTAIDALLACAVLLGLLLNAVAGAWWADPAAGLVIVYYALREARSIHHHLAPRDPHPDRPSSVVDDQILLR